MQTDLQCTVSVDEHFLSPALLLNSTWYSPASSSFNSNKYLFFVVQSRNTDMMLTFISLHWTISDVHAIPLLYVEWLSIQHFQDNHCFLKYKFFRIKFFFQSQSQLQKTNGRIWFMSKNYKTHCTCESN